ncbi:hypothetical protein predicted by Glimmer/Critica [Helicobacter pylori B8]|uniref:Uncharacterized protein n=1 Tax=Helicobacter pylori (strain B8) TaxID=693745 RepID=D7FGA4_HELP3|nr:hypothetical protein predicted by Glimmer/Critica [Helicobacter pylori B8]
MISASSFRFILKILLAFLMLNEKRAFLLVPKNTPLHSSQRRMLFKWLKKPG